MGTRIIPDQHACYFRRLWRLPDQTEVFDPALEAYYWRVKKVFDGTQQTLDVRDLLWIALNCGVPFPAEKQETIVDWAASRAVKPGQMVEIKWRKKWEQAEFKGMHGTEAVVQMPGSAEERRIPQEHVRLVGTAA